MRKMAQNQDNAIEHWLTVTRSQFIGGSPELLALFDIYAAEAVFGRFYIDSDLACLRPGGSILEVGAGSLLLSCQLVREGFDVTALEPIGDGFSHFDQMRRLVLLAAHSQGCCPKILDLPAEALDVADRFDYAFSVNVMEHVAEMSGVLEKVGKSLVLRASYRFTCPNYIFPYEPHFNIPTLFSKRLTEKMLWRYIFDSVAVPDPAGTWKSINWINVIQIKRVVRRLPNLKVTFSRSMLASTLERIAVDTEFARRRSPAIRNLILMLVRLRIHLLFRFIPATMQPIIDCRVEKIEKIEKTNKLEAC